MTDDNQPEILSPAVQADQQLSAPISVGTMLQEAIKGGITPENVATLEKLMDLYERDQKRQAEQQFARAFTALQNDLPRVKAVKPVPDKQGGVKYYFAPYEEIDEEVRPFLNKHGFTTSFSMSYDGERVSQKCILQHVGGHVRENSFSVRVGSGPPGASAAQADGAAATYAKRHAYCNALNIVIDAPDTDGKAAVQQEGAPITRDQIQYLREQVRDTGADEAKFLALAGAKSYEDITAGSYPVLIRFLTAKARSK